VKVAIIYIYKHTHIYICFSLSLFLSVFARRTILIRGCVVLLVGVHPVGLAPPPREGEVGDGIGGDSLYLYNVYKCISLLVVKLVC